MHSFKDKETNNYIQSHFNETILLQSVKKKFLPLVSLLHFSSILFRLKPIPRLHFGCLCETERIQNAR